MQLDSTATVVNKKDDSMIWFLSSFVQRIGSSRNADVSVGFQCFRRGNFITIGFANILEEMELKDEIRLAKISNETDFKHHANAFLQTQQEQQQEQQFQQQQQKRTTTSHHLPNQLKDFFFSMKIHDYVIIRSIHKGDKHLNFVHDREFLIGKVVGDVRWLSGSHLPKEIDKDVLNGDENWAVRQVKWIRFGNYANLGPNLLSNNRLLSRVHGIDIQSLFSVSEPILKQHWFSIEGGKQPVLVTNPALKRKRENFSRENHDIDDESEMDEEMNFDAFEKQEKFLFAKQQKIEKRDEKFEQLTVMQQQQQQLFQQLSPNTSSESDLMSD